MKKREAEVKMILKGESCKLTCKILAIFAKIAEVCFIIAAIAVGIAGIMVGVAQKDIDLNQMVSEAANELGDSAMVVMNDVTINTFLEKSHSEQMTFILIGIALATLIFVFLSIFARHVYRFFKNLTHGKTPFTLENVDILQRIAVWLFISIVTMDLSSLILSVMLGGSGTIGFTVSLSSYALGFMILVLAVIFRHGYELESKKK